MRAEIGKTSAVELELGGLLERRQQRGPGEPVDLVHGDRRPAVAHVSEGLGDEAIAGPDPLLRR